jgi:hypothetical protein
VLTLILVALAVGLGNFGASVSIGLSGVGTATRIKVGVVFGIFEAGMPLVGLLVGHGVAHALGSASRYAGGALLVVMGAWQLIQAAYRGRKGVPALPLATGRLLLTLSRSHWTIWWSGSASASRRRQWSKPSWCSP